MAARRDLEERETLRLRPGEGQSVAGKMKSLFSGRTFRGERNHQIALTRSE